MSLINRGLNFKRDFSWNKVIRSGITLIIPIGYIKKLKRAEIALSVISLFEIFVFRIKSPDNKQKKVIALNGKNIWENLTWSIETDRSPPAIIATSGLNLNPMK